MLLAAKLREQVAFVMQHLPHILLVHFPCPCHWDRLPLQDVIRVLEFCEPGVRKELDYVITGGRSLPLRGHNDCDGPLVPLGVWDCDHATRAYGWHTRDRIFEVDARDKLTTPLHQILGPIRNVHYVCRGDRCDVASLQVTVVELVLAYTTPIANSHPRTLHQQLTGMLPVMWQYFFQV